MGVQPMITKEAADNIVYGHCQNLIDSLNNMNLKDIDFYISKLRIYDSILNDDQKAVLYEAEQVLDALTTEV